MNIGAAAATSSPPSHPAVLLDLALRYLHLCSASGRGALARGWLSSMAALARHPSAASSGVPGAPAGSAQAPAAGAALLQALQHSLAEACVFWGSAAFFAAYGCLPERVGPCVLPAFMMQNMQQQQRGCNMLWR